MTSVEAAEQRRAFFNAFRSPPSVCARWAIVATFGTSLLLRLNGSRLTAKGYIVVFVVSLGLVKVIEIWTRPAGRR